MPSGNGVSLTRLTGAFFPACSRRLYACVRNRVFTSFTRAATTRYIRYVNPPREKSHRLPRVSYQRDACVVFTACVADRHRLFDDAGAVLACVDILRSVAGARHCTIPIYCFMPDHLHVMARGNDDTSDAWQMMVDFKQQTGFWLKQHKPHIHWQKDFHDHIVQRAADLGAQMRYIAANPVRKGLVADWRDYPHTGAIGIELEPAINGALTL